MSITKTGFHIDGVEVTSEHLGDKLEVLKSNDIRWLPVGFVATIKKVFSDGVIELQDTGDEDSCYSVDLSSTYWDFKWVVPAIPKKSSSKQTRKKLAKAIREAKKALDNAIKEAEDVGMVVNISKDDVKITFNPPVEEY